MENTNVKKKNIGLCLTKLHKHTNHGILNNISRLASDKGFNLITFYLSHGAKNDEIKEQAYDLYVIKYAKLDGIIICEDCFRNEELFNRIISDANELNIPIVIIGKKPINAKNISSVSFDIKTGFEKMLEHLILEHKKTNPILVSYSDRQEYKKVFENFLEANSIKADFDNQILEYDASSCADKAAEIVVSKKVDSVICIDEDVAFFLIERLKENNLSVPEDVELVSLSRDYKSTYIDPQITSVEKDIEKLCEEVVNIIENGIETGKALDCLVPVNYIFSKSTACSMASCRDSKGQLELFYKEKKAIILADAKLHRLDEKIIYASQIGDIAEILKSSLPDNAFFCVKNTFMQDIFQEDSIPREPVGTDKYYIIADTRKENVGTVSFELSALFPNFQQVVDGDYTLIITPVRYMGIQYGYIVVASKEYMIISSIIEKYVVEFNAAIGRYIGDRKLRFANSELFNATESMRQLRERDILTGMYNSKGFIRKINELKAECIKTGEKIVLICVDLDGLGKINDIYGHSEGDIVIQTLAEILNDTVDNDSIAAHLGSDEFVLAIRTNLEPEERIESYFTSLDVCIMNFNAISRKEYSIEINKTFLAVTPFEDTDMAAVLDEALGRKRVIKQNRRDAAKKDIHDNNNDINEEEYRLVTDLIDNNKFKYAFQPIVSAINGKVIAFEALMRADAEKFVSPLTILKYATMDKRLYDIEYATFNNVLAVVDKNMDTLGDIKIFVNSIPGSYMNEADYSDFCQKYNHLFDNLVVEITEQTELDDDNLACIRSRSEACGFELAIDDYGTGYSNTTSLLRYLPNYIKIDRMLITNIQEDPKKQHFVKNIIEFAHDNNFMALAEGVETSEELNAVIHMGIDLIQGYYTGKPAFDFVTEISEDIVNEIVKANADFKGNAKRKVYVSDNDSEIFLMRLVLENYTTIVLCQEEVTIIGNLEYSSSIQIKVKDNTKCKLHLRDVNLVSAEGTACIDLGTGAELTLDIEGENRLSGNAIKVPKSSKLVLLGENNAELHLAVNGEKSYGIGNDWNSQFGEIELLSDGLLNIKAGGTYSIGIGGGIYKDGSGIKILKGRIIMGIKGSNVLGIGAVNGNIPIQMNECKLTTNISAFSGVAIGTWNGEANVGIKNAFVELSGSGNSLCGIGSNGECHGILNVETAHIDCKLSGSNIILIGNKAKGMDIKSVKARFDLAGDGINVVGMGSADRSAVLDFFEGLVNLKINSQNPLGIGALEENCHFKDLTKNIEGFN